MPQDHQPVADLIAKPPDFFVALFGGHLEVLSGNALLAKRQRSVIAQRVVRARAFLGDARGSAELGVLEPGIRFGAVGHLALAERQRALDDCTHCVDTHLIEAFAPRMHLIRFAARPVIPTALTLVKHRNVSERLGAQGVIVNVTLSPVLHGHIASRIVAGGYSFGRNSTRSIVKGSSMSVATAEQKTRQEIPVEETWDLSSLYESDAQWEEELSSARDLIDKAAAHRGSLGESAAGLKAALDDIYAANLRIERLAVYAHLRRDEDLTVGERLAAYDRAITLAIEAGQRLAFVQPELLQLDAECFDALAADPLLAEYGHVLHDLGRRREHTRSIEVEELLARSYDVARTSREAFNSLNDADLKFGTVKDEDGNEIELTKGRFQLLMQSKDRDVRKAAYEAFFGEYNDHVNTTAALYAGSVRTDAFYAAAKNYESPRAAALFDDNIDAAVYDSLLAAVRESKPVIERFLALRA